MSDLVERSDVIKMINRLIKNKDECIVKNESFREGMVDGYCRVRSELCDVPSVQPDITLPVVKCKDCVYLGNSVGVGIMEEFHICMKRIMVVRESGLCIWGKEKEDE